MHRISRGALAAAFALTASAAVASAQTPLLHYTFDESSGQAVDTGVGPAANGDLVGGAVRTSNTPAGFGSAVDFTNDNPYAHVLGPDAAKLDGVNQMTISTWLNVSSYPGGNVRLASKQEPSGSGFTFNMNSTVNDGTVGADDFKLFFAAAGAGAAGFTFGTSSADVDANTISAADNWVFLAVTYDGTQGSNNTRFYIGDADTPVAELGTAQTLGQVTIDGGAGRFGVGFTDAAPTADLSVDGFQDDVRVYGEALSLGDLDTIRLQNIPEPSSIAAFGALGLLSLRRRRA